MNDQAHERRGERHQYARAREVGAGQWALIQTRPAAEVRVAAALKLRAPALDVYVPMETVWRRSAHRKAPHRRPLIRGYVFAAMEDGDLALVHEIEGAVCFVTSGGRPARIGPAFVTGLREAEAAGRFDKTRRERPVLGERRKVGETVRITRGPFEGVVATVVKLKGARRVQLLLSLLGGSQTVDVELTKVALAQRPAA